MHEGSQFGPYQLIKRIAFGGMAEIHLAKTTGIGGFEKLLALKVIHPKFSEDQEFIDMLVDEAKIAVQLSHVNIGQIFDLGKIEGTYYIAMEFIDGKDLYQLLVKCSELEIQIPFDIIAFICIEMSAGLQYAHTKSDNYGRPLNLIHRDISPQNILVSYDGEVKIVDFGIAKASQRSRETESGIIKGKFFYMSPEQAWGDDIDGRTDIFSTGICLYEMITGEMLYNEDKALALLDKVRQAEIPNMRARRPDLPPLLERVTLQALARERDQRFQSAGALQGALSGFLYSTWPNFNRRRVADFMRQVFGDNRFVLPMPPPVAPAPAPVDVIDQSSTGQLMNASDFDPTSGKSVIFDLRSAAQASAAEVSGYDPTIAAGYAADAGLADYLDEGEEERTIAEPVWASGGAPELEDFDEDRTMAVGAIDAAPPAAPQTPGGSLEQPTSLYDQMKLAAPRSVQPPPEPEMEQPTRAVLSPGRRAEPQPAQAPPAPEMENTKALLSPGRRAAPQPAAPPPGGAQPTPVSPPNRPSMPRLSPPSTPAPVEPAVPRKTFRPVSTPRSAPNLSPVTSIDTMQKRKPKGGGSGGFVRKLASPVGIAGVVVLLLLIYGAVAFLPTLFADPVPQVASLVIHSEPEGATLKQNGQAVAGVTPITLNDLPVGSEHLLQLELRGFEPHEERVRIRAEEIKPDGSPINRRIFLVKARGRLEIYSEPSGAEVYIDNKYFGDTPVKRDNIERSKDKMLLLLRKDGYRDKSAELLWGDEVVIKHTETLQKRGSK
ncbi:MAG: protein kinase [Myxococcales bacterium]|nr:protein kinase [Myxococcales bacterium]